MDAVPNEILCIFFELTCAENLLQEYPWPLVSRHGPITKLISPAITYLPALAISAVCTQWRSLALASPRLWPRLRLETSPDEMSEGGCFLSTLQLYLDRSADAPLMIDVETVGIGIRQMDSLAPIFLLDYTSRWKSFSYTGSHSLDGWIGSSRSFPILEDLAIIRVNTVTLEADLQCFKDAPNLRTLTTEYLKTHLPWKHLLSLNLRIPGKNDMALLHQHLDLIVLKLGSCRLTFPKIIRPLPTRLESFTLVESVLQHPDLLPNIFSSFTLPSLTELVIDSELAESELIWSPDAFSAFISRSSCVLTTLSLNAVIVSDLDLIAALRLLPSLIQFTTDKLVNVEGRSSITSHFIACMHSSSALLLLPQLHTLSIKIYDDSFDDFAFVDMVSSRWLPGSLAASVSIKCLRSLVLHFRNRDVDKKAYKPLLQLDRMGMQVVVTGKYGFLVED